MAYVQLHSPCRLRKSTATDIIQRFSETLVYMNVVKDDTMPSIPAGVYVESWSLFLTF